MASPEPHIVTIELNSNELTMTYGYGRQQSAIPLGLNDLHLPMNPFNMMTPLSLKPVMATPSCSPADDDIPIQEEPINVFDISTPSMMVTSVNAWETSSDLGTFYSDEPRRIWLAQSPSPLLRTRKQKTKMSCRMSFPKTVLLHICEACGQPWPTELTFEDSESKKTSFFYTEVFNYFFT